MRKFTHALALILALIALPCAASTQFLEGEKEELVDELALEHYITNPHDYDGAITEEDLNQARSWFYNADQYEFFDPFHNKKIKGIKAEVIGEGNCAFTALQLSRITAVENVINQSSNRLLRSLVREDFVHDKQAFVRSLEDLQTDVSNYVSFVTNLGVDDSGHIIESPNSRAGFDDYMSAVAYANDKHVLVLNYDNADESRKTLIPSSIFRNPKLSHAPISYLIFEGHGVHGNKGLHYNMMVPAERPDEMSEKDFDTLIVQAWRRQQNTLKYNHAVKTYVEVYARVLKERFGEEHSKAESQFFDKEEDLEVPEPEDDTLVFSEAILSLPKHVTVKGGWSITPADLNLKF